MYEATFWDTPRFSAYARYPASVLHATSNVRSAAASRMRSRISGVSGPWLLPSPKICVVTPWVSSLSERWSCSMLVYEWLSMLMKPGATASPAASITVPAFASPSGAIDTMRSPSTATSAAYGSPPLPS